MVVVVPVYMPACLQWSFLDAISYGYRLIRSYRFRSRRFFS